jgi:hypothetical protein
MDTNILNITLEKIDDIGNYVCKFKNVSSDCKLILRELLPEKHINIISDSGVRAEPIISSAFGAEVGVFTLKGGETNKVKINVFNEFVFYEEGFYKIWIEYSSDKKTATWEDDKPHISYANALSNELEIFVDNTRITPKEHKIDKERFVKAVQAEQNRRWWQFWKW